MEELFEDFPDALTNTRTIAQRCVLEMPLGETHLPNFTYDNDLSDAEYLRELSFTGLKKRIHQIDENYKERLDFELKIIAQFVFKLLYDCSRLYTMGCNHQVPVGPGRGSGAGSMVAYALSITDLDPIHHGLLFERFLNPMRVSMPDFDIDFCMEKRDWQLSMCFNIMELIKYLKSLRLVPWLQKQSYEMLVVCLECRILW